MIDIGHSDFFITFDAPEGMQVQGERVVVPNPL